MKPVHSHLMIGSTSRYCEWLGTMAGRAKAEVSGVCSCDFSSLHAANQARKALQPLFVSRVSVVRGECPESA